MNDPTDRPRASGDRPASAGDPSAGNEWLQLARLTSEVGSDFSKLLLLELKLAASSLGRIIVLALLCLPLLVLAWIALAAFPAALIAQWSGQVSLGVLTFLCIQLAALGLIVMAAKRYRRNLSLPNSRRQLQYLVAGPSANDE